MTQNNDHQKSEQSKSTNLQNISNSDDIFLKYREGFNLSFAFKPFSLNVSQEQENIFFQCRQRGTYKKYTQKDKQNALRLGYDIKEIAQKLQIPRRNILRWMHNGCKRKQGGGRPTDLNMQKILYEKISLGQIKGEIEIRKAAIQASGSSNFKASKGWFSKFSRRYILKTGHQIQSDKN